MNEPEPKIQPENPEPANTNHDPRPLDVIEGRAAWSVVEAEALTFLRTLPDACVDAVITDPPYSSGGQFRGDRVQRTNEKYVQTEHRDRHVDFTGDNRDQRSFGYWCALWLGECLRVAKPGSPIVLFTDWRQLPATTDALQAGGWVWRGIAVWDKTEGCRPQMGRFRAQAEYLVWGSNGPVPAELAKSVGVLPGVFRHVVRKADKLHLTAKPTPLMRDVVKICPPGGLVLDPFLGSGTTIVGALMEGRRGIGCERIAHYAEVSRGRCAGVAP